MTIPFLCRVWYHNWDKWSTPVPRIAYGFDLVGRIEHEVRTQDRVCLGCGATQQRQVK